MRLGAMLGSSVWVVSRRWVRLVVWRSVCLACAGYLRCACWCGCVDGGAFSAFLPVELVPAFATSKVQEKKSNPNSPRKVDAEARAGDQGSNFTATRNRVTIIDFNLFTVRFDNQNEMIENLNGFNRLGRLVTGYVPCRFSKYWRKPIPRIRWNSRG